MRMWMVNPRGMCRQHLLGEHVEIHMFLGAMNKGYRMDGYAEKGLLEVPAIPWRHLSLVHEMLVRGYNHRSPLPDYMTKVLQNLPEDIRRAVVPREEAYQELVGRCSKCDDLMAEIPEGVRCYGWN